MKSHLLLGWLLGSLLGGLGLLCGLGSLGFGSSLGLGGLGSLGFGSCFLKDGLHGPSWAIVGLRGPSWAIAGLRAFDSFYRMSGHTRHMGHHGPSWAFTDLYGPS